MQPWWTYKKILLTPNFWMVVYMKTLETDQNIQHTWCLKNNLLFFMYRKYRKRSRKVIVQQTLCTLHWEETPGSLEPLTCTDERNVRIKPSSSTSVQWRQQDRGIVGNLYHEHVSESHTHRGLSRSSLVCEYHDHHCVRSSREHKPASGGEETT